MLWAMPLAFIMLLVIFVPLALWFAFAASILWGWFLVPLGLPPIGVWHMWGISLTLGVIRPRPIFVRKDDRPYNWEEIINAIILVPAITLGLGAAIKFWIMP